MSNPNIVTPDIAAFATELASVSSSRELVHSTLVNELADYVASLKDPPRYSGYWEEGMSPETAIRLPEKFKELFGNSDELFIVGYEDRRGTWCKEGTRGQQIQISSVPNRVETDDRIAEWKMRIHTDEGQIVTDVVKVETFNQKSAQSMNDDKGAGVAEPYGSAEYCYKIKDQGTSSPHAAEMSRLDEGIINWEGQDTRIRWNRSLNFDLKGVHPNFTYTDSFIIDLLNKSPLRSTIKTNIQGQLTKPEKITVMVGLSGSHKLYSSEDGVLDVYGDLNESILAESLKVLSVDSVYSPLCKDNIQSEALIENIIGRVQMLMQEWDSPENVYKRRSVLNGAQALLLGVT